MTRAALSELGQATVLGDALADVAAAREDARRARIRRLGLVAGLVTAWLVWRAAAENPVELGLPPALGHNLPAVLIVVMLAAVLLIPMLGAGRSPHVLYRPAEIDVTLDDVKGARVVRDEVVKTLNLFLAYRTFREQMGGTPRRALLFEGPPGTGKTYMARAMAREAGVPFLFVSSSAFQSMYYGQTNRKLRSYFKALRKAARREGGAIGFLEEIDAIGATRNGMGGTGEGVSGVVNELLIQLQSFDEPPLSGRVRGWFVDQLNRVLPAEAQLRRPVVPAAHVLLVGATNRASDLDPALLRPGRFDRSIHFDLPSRADRREIIDYYLSKKAHVPDLDVPARRDALAAATAGYSPVMIEHIFDEGLVWALRRGAAALDWGDLQQAKLTEELGLKQPVEYTDAERLALATHEAGHATVAYLVGRAGTDGEPGGTVRQLDVLSIVKRSESLGLLAHSDGEERFTKTRSEIVSLIEIALGGLVAEELAFGEAGTGPAGDLKVATNAAAQMVGALGMGGSLISFDALGMAGAQNLAAKVVSDEDAREALEAILADAKVETERLLRTHRHIHAALRDALLARHELVGDEILTVIEEAETAHLALDLRDDSVPTDDSMLRFLEAQFGGGPFSPRPPAPAG